MENDKAPPKLDLTRIEEFDSFKESEGPDLGTLLGLTPAQEVMPQAAPPPLPERAEIASPPPLPLGTEPPPPMEPLSETRRFSEQLSVAKELVPAAFPFSVMIDGPLEAEEKERLLDFLNRENLGIRPMDLEPQLEEGRVLIPRISEYAAVLIVQALRSCGARIRIGPSDEIFATEDTRAQADGEIAPHLNPPPFTSYDTAHAADRIPVTPESSLRELGPYVVIDIVTASAALSVQAVEAERSTEYQDLLEALQRELRYKAWRKGASAVLNFSVQLDLLTLPSRYRMLVTGSAVRAAQVPPNS